VICNVCRRKPEPPEETYAVRESRSLYRMRNGFDRDSNPRPQTGADVNFEHRSYCATLTTHCMYSYTPCHSDNSLYVFIHSFTNLPFVQPGDDGRVKHSNIFRSLANAVSGFVVCRCVSIVGAAVTRRRIQRSEVIGQRSVGLLGTLREECGTGYPRLASLKGGVSFQFKDLVTSNISACRKIDNTLLIKALFISWKRSN
jgi:hypothetical protein